MSPNSKVWIYQANRVLTDEEVNLIQPKAEVFAKQWASHGDQVFGKSEVKYNRFIILMADESMTGVSGCSIDSSVRFIREIGAELGIDFFDRWCIAYKDGDVVKSANREEFEQLMANNTVNDITTVFNNLVTTKADLDAKWEISLKDSWHANVFA